MAPESIGQRIRRDREAEQLTQRDLAERLGVGTPHLSKIENDKDKASDELLRRLAATLGQDPDEYLLVARRLPVWAADMFAEHPAAWLRLLRQRHGLTPGSLGGDLRDARRVHCPTCDALPLAPCVAENGGVIRGWHRERRRVATGEPRSEFDDLLARSSLGGREVLDVSAETPQWAVEEVLRRARRCCARCGDPEGWHQHGPAEWGECDGEGCGCEMYQEPEWTR